MSHYSEHGTQKAIHSAAAARVNEYMAKDSAECLKNLRAQIEHDEAELPH